LAINDYLLWRNQKKHNLPVLYNPESEGIEGKFFAKLKRAGLKAQIFKKTKVSGKKKK